MIRRALSAVHQRSRPRRTYGQLDDHHSLKLELQRAQVRGHPLNLEETFLNARAADLAFLRFGSFIDRPALKTASGQNL